MRPCLAITHPDLVKEWNLSLNNDKTPYDFTYGSHKKVMWKCKT
jgi:hypothetical protein